MHLGAGRWIIIDSCIDAKNGRPAALDYLDALGVPPSAVILIVASHWHTDHIRGLATMVEECAAAQFCCSMALNNKEFLSVASLYAEVSHRLPAGPEELKRAFETVISRRKSVNYRPLKWLRSDMDVFVEHEHMNAIGIPINIRALSPCDEMITRAVEEMAAYHSLCLKSDQLCLLTPGHPNHISVALKVQVGERQVLLGSDLENTCDPLIGWSAVLSSGADGPAEVFKVAHHGSRSGHSDRVWVEMLEPNPLALLTPFRWGCHCLPDADDRKRILALTDRAYITADPNRDRIPPKRASKVERLIAGTARRRWLAAGSLGHVRWRADLRRVRGEGTVELFGEAMPLGNVA